MKNEKRSDPDLIVNVILTFIVVVIALIYINRPKSLEVQLMELQIEKLKLEQSETE